MTIADIIQWLESVAPPAYQEEYDNACLITGMADWECRGVLTTLDVTEKVIAEAVSANVNLIVAHHPLIFRGLKKIDGNHHVGRALISAIKQDVAVYAAHTKLDAIVSGVNGRIADKLGLRDRKILSPAPSLLKKLFTFVPPDHADLVRNALFATGAGHIGNYSETSFNAEGFGTYLPGAGTRPFLGEHGKRQQEKEIKVEVVFPGYLQTAMVKALTEAHPYEEVAYDIVTLSNHLGTVGSGLVGVLPEPLPESDFLALLKRAFGLSVIRHTALRGQPIGRVAICGGAGSFLISRALSEDADIFVTADIKYHEFFETRERMVLADIGHFESEQFTADLLVDVIRQKFPTFAILKSGTLTNPVHYYL
jgi:dinuclear metal center YbgI/SA1388 family protein